MKNFGCDEIFLTYIESLVGQPESGRLSSDQSHNTAPSLLVSDLYTQVRCRKRSRTPIFCYITIARPPYCPSSTGKELIDEYHTTNHCFH